METLRDIGKTCRIKIKWANIERAQEGHANRYVLISHFPDEANSDVLASGSKGRLFPFRCFTPLLPPLPRQLPRRRRRQHGLAKALEDRRHAIEPLAAGIYSSEGGVELSGDAMLFVERRNGNLKFKHLLLRQRLVGNPIVLIKNQ